MRCWSLVISFIYRYYKGCSLTAPTYFFSYIHTYMRTYIRTYMNAFAHAYIDGIHDRFVQSCCVSSVYVCECVLCVLGVHIYYVLIHVPVHDMQQVCMQLIVHVYLHVCMTACLYMCIESRDIIKLSSQKNKLCNYLFIFFL